MADIALKENIMGTQKMSKLILFTDNPLMVSLFINSLYNFVNSMFVSQVSEKAIPALVISAAMWFWRKGCRRMEGGNFQ